MIREGDRLPSATFVMKGEDGLTKVTTEEYFGGRKVALFAVPGAFTSTCTNNHLPGFVASRDAFREKGVDAVACVAVNDVFVLGAWANHAGAGEAVEFLSDGNAEFARAAGFDQDLSARGFGIRSIRYAMLVDDCVVKVLLVEELPGQAETSGAESLLSRI